MRNLSQFLIKAFKNNLSNNSFNALRAIMLSHDTKYIGGNTHPQDFLEYFISMIDHWTCASCPSNELLSKACDYMVEFQVVLRVEQTCNLKHSIVRDSKCMITLEIKNEDIFTVNHAIEHYFSEVHFPICSCSLAKQEQCSTYFCLGCSGHQAATMNKKIARLPGILIFGFDFQVIKNFFES